MVRSVSFQGWRPERNFCPGFSAGDTVSLNQLAEARFKIQRHLTSQGYLQATVDLLTSADTGGLDLTFVVTPGPRMRIRGWELAGVDTADARELSRRLSGKGRFFSRSWIQQTVDRLLQLYRDRGYPFARIEFTDLIATDSGVKPVLQITTGPKVKISFLTFVSNPQINPQLLQRYSGFYRPADYQAAQLRRWRSNLENSGWLRVDSIDLIEREGLFGARFWITPARTGELDAALGYLPENRRLSGWFNLTLFNLLNRGRSAAFRWRSLYTRTDYRLNYTEPWPINLPLILSGTITHQVHDTSYAFSRLEIGAVLGNAPLRLRLSSGYDRLAGLRSKTGFWAGTGLEYDLRDDERQHRRGNFWEMITRGGRQSVTAESTGFAGEVTARWVAALPLIGNTALTGTINFNLKHSSLPLAEPELYAVGGPDNIRGFREGEFTTSRLLWLNLEPRLYLPRRSRLHLFIDAGLLATATGGNRLIAGYGWGGRWETNFGILGLDFAIPLPRSPLQAKIHLNYQTGF